MVQSIYKKTLILIITIVVIFSSGMVMYFMSTMSRLQNDQLQKKAREFADIVAINLDIDALESFKARVQEAYSKAEGRISNDHMGTDEYEAYVSGFEYLKRTEEFRELFSELRKLQDVSDVDCFYLCYIDKQTKTVVYLVDVGDNNICQPGSFDILRGEDLRALEHPNMSLVPSISNNEIYGDIVGSAEPIFNRSGRVVAYLGVDISTKSLTKQLDRLFVNTFITVLIISILLVAVSLYVSGRIISRPLAIHNEMLVESESLKKENATLARRARAAERIAELSGSLSSLLAHMPAMTYTKDIETGRYIACNQMFLEFVDKRSASDIVGLTDEELFDSETAAHYKEIDRKVAAYDGPYVFSEDITDARGNVRNFQTTKLIFKDENGRDCILGMSVDISELVMVKKENAKTKDAYNQAVSESLTYSSIAGALFRDYLFLYYVDIDSDRFKTYASAEDELSIQVRSEGDDFFGLSIKNVPDIVYEDDRERFTASFSKENILRSIENEGRYLITYRAMLDGKPRYTMLKAVRLDNDDRHIIIGVADVDTQTREREAAERVIQEKITYERIAALAGRYICIYTVDPETDEFVEYTATQDYASLSLPKRGDDFFEKTRLETERVIYEEDKEGCIPLLTKQNMLDSIRRQGMFTIKYRLVIDGEPLYVRLKATIVEEKDGPRILVGVSDIDLQEKANQQYADNLATAQAQARLDAMTGAGNKYAYLDMENRINSSIRRGEAVSFAIAVCDVNNLKKTNDTRGHKAGDELIISAYNIISEVFEGGSVYRVGGDEFAVVLMGASQDRVEEMRQRLEDVSVRNSTQDKVVVACGISRYEGSDMTMEDVFNQADSAMYENKQWLKQQKA